MTHKSTGIPRLTGREVGELVRMPHGGALRAGGTNRGGPGRPPEALRAMSRDQYARLLEELDQRDLSQLTATELSQLANTTGRLGGLATDDPRDAGQVTVRIVREVVPLPHGASRPIDSPLLPPTTPAKTW